MNKLFDYNNSGYKFLHNRKHWLYAFLLLLPFGLPNNYFNFLVDDYFEKVFTNENNTTIAYFASIILCIITYSFISKFKNRYIISPTITFLTVLVSWWIWYFQIFDSNKHNEFIGIANLDWFYFAYIIYFVSGLSVSLFLWGNYSLKINQLKLIIRLRSINIIPTFFLEKFRLVKRGIKEKYSKLKECMITFLFAVQKNESQGFLTDSPIKTFDDDSLGRKEYAAEIARRLLLGTYQKAFALGITGSWGSGKTSFVNLIKDAINQEKTTDKIIIEFNPWNSQNPNQIIEDFFKTFKDALSPYSSELSSEVVSYAKDLVKNEKGFWGILSTRIINFFDTNDTISEKYDAINETLRKLDKKIIIIIDDLDRLDKSEIIEVIRLIRNTANFYNTCFVVAYDKGYVTNAIGDMNDYQKEYYLEKIFQLEVVLPQKESGSIFTALSDKIKELYPNDYLKIMKGFNHLGERKIENYLLNIRDVNRFLNSFILNYSMVKHDVLIDEFILIELVRFKYPEIIDFIYQNKDNFFIPGNRLSLKVSTDKDKTDFRSILKNRLSNVSDKDINSVYEIFNILFPDVLSGYYSKSNIQKTIANQNYFYRYFALRILNNQISQQEFDNERNKSLDDFKAAIRNWIKKGFAKNLLEIFMYYQSESKEDYKKHIITYFYFLNSTINYQQATEDINKNLLTKLTYKSYTNFLTTNELKQFIDSTLKDAKEPFYAEINFLSYINNHYDTEHLSFPLTIKERLNIVENYFLQYLNKNKSYDFRIFWEMLYSTGYKREVIDTHDYEYFIANSMKSNFKNFFINSSNKALDLIIVENSRAQGFYRIVKIISDDIESYDDFIAFLNNNLKDSKKLKELNTFYEKFKTNEYKNIEFSFKELKINRW